MVSKFQTKNGCEYYITLEPEDKNISFDKNLDFLFQQYEKICKDNHLDNSTLIYFKIFLSDISNQSDYISEFLNHKKDFFYFLVGQPPASGSKISIEVYHIQIKDNKTKKINYGNHIAVKHNKYTSIWGSIVPDIHGNIHEQTLNVLNTLDNQIKKYNGAVKNNVIRTWFYIRDIDNNYKGMIKCRREWFEESGMTKTTNYIASTGIEGSSLFHSHLVHLNYLASLNLNQDQITFMSAPDYMNPTHEYGATFERGTQVVYGDCSHYYISGTASIDNKGNILYLKDIIKQTERIFNNIEALLTRYHSDFNDLKIILVYLRDFSDYNITENFLKKIIPDSIAYIILKAPVCRPGWLIEIEGIAKNNYCNKSFNDFL